MTLAEEIRAKAKEYLDFDEQLASSEIPMLTVGFVIEEFRARRNYPDSYTEEKIEADMRKNINLLSMMVVDVFAHYGAEGEMTHSEKNISRTYESSYISSTLLARIIPFVQAL